MTSVHVEGCMCDICIQIRTREKVQKRETDEAVKAYEERRGGEIGSISVADALKSKR